MTVMKDVIFKDSNNSPEFFNISKRIRDLRNAGSIFADQAELRLLIREEARGRQFADADGIFDITDEQES